MYKIKILNFSPQNPPPPSCGLFLDPGFLNPGFDQGHTLVFLLYFFAMQVPRHKIKVARPSLFFLNCFISFLKPKGGIVLYFGFMI